MPLYRRIARRGFSNYPHKKKIPEVYLRDIDARFSEGELINPALLKQAGLISGCPPGVKILSNGGITKKFKFESLAFSASAREKILAAGGEIAGEEGKNGG
jgi:large subunit ribosomal protein L15